MDGKKARVESKMYRMLLQKKSEEISKSKQGSDNVGHLSLHMKGNSLSRAMEVTKKLSIERSQRNNQTANKDHRRSLQLNKADSLVMQNRLPSANYNESNDEDRHHHNHNFASEHIHVNHHEFEDVDWQIVYQYMPVESQSVYERRLRNGEIQSWWGR